MSFHYAVLGAGRQGTAAAYDLGRFGDAERILLLDRDERTAQAAARHINELLEADLVTAQVVDVRDCGDVEMAIDGIDASISAVPYFFNPTIALACINAGSHLCDLGGNTDITRRVLSLNDDAEAAEVCIIPDCGLAPGLCNILACYGIGQLDEVDAVKIRCGGLPQDPKPPLFYKILFNVSGLTNEYFGDAYFLRDGKVTKVKTFTELEEIEFASPLGSCEAFVTSGGTSTCPWSFEGKVRNFDYKTVRYPGHYERFKVMHDLGLLDLEPVDLRGTKVIPRELFHTVVAPKLTFPGDPDLVALRVTVSGKRDDYDFQTTLEVMDFADDQTGFSAMQRCTGWSAGVVATMMAQGETGVGAIPLERAVDPSRFLELFKDRGIRFTESAKRTMSTDRERS